MTLSTPQIELALIIPHSTIFNDDVTDQDFKQQAIKYFHNINIFKWKMSKYKKNQFNQIPV